LLQDHVCTYKILSTELNTNDALLTRAHGLMYVNAENFITVNSSSQMRGHIYKLYKHRYSSTVCQYFFANRIVNVWNSLPPTVNFASVASFKQSLKHIDLSVHLKCANL